VGYYEIPARYGLNLRELAISYNYERNLGLDIKVIKTVDWRKDPAAINLGWISSWIPPSSAIPSPDNAFIYSTTVYFEETNILKYF